MGQRVRLSIHFCCFYIKLVAVQILQPVQCKMQNFFCIFKIKKLYLVHFYKWECPPKDALLILNTTGFAIFSHSLLHLTICLCFEIRSESSTRHKMTSPDIYLTSQQNQIYFLQTTHTKPVYKVSNYWAITFTCCSCVAQTLKTLLLYRVQVFHCFTRCFDISCAHDETSALWAFIGKMISGVLTFLFGMLCVFKAVGIEPPRFICACYINTLCTL